MLNSGYCNQDIVQAKLPGRQSLIAFCKDDRVVPIKQNRDHGFINMHLVDPFAIRNDHVHEVLDAGTLASRACLAGIVYLAIGSSKSLDLSDSLLSLVLVAPSALIIIGFFQIINLNEAKCRNKSA